MNVVVEAYVNPLIIRNSGETSNQVGIKGGSASDALCSDGGGAVAYSICRDALDRSGEGAGGTAAERSGLGVLENESQALKAKGPGAVAYNIVGLGQQGRNHAYEAQATGSVQGKGDSASGNEAGTVVAFTINATHSCAREDHAFESDTARCLDQTGGFASQQGGNVVAFTIHGTPASEVASEASQAACLRARAPGGVDNSTTNVVAFHLTQDPIDSHGHTPAISKGSASGCATVGVQSGMMVRRLTEVECLRLQALPPWWLDLDPPLSGSRKYAMTGNAGVVNCVWWILYRLRTAIEAAGG
jgi:site-specific DNA-cytosine methylase